MRPPETPPGTPGPAGTGPPSLPAGGWSRAWVGDTFPGGDPKITARQGQTPKSGFQLPTPQVLLLHRAGSSPTSPFPAPPSQKFPRNSEQRALGWGRETLPGRTWGGAKVAATGNLTWAGQVGNKGGSILPRALAQPLPGSQPGWSGPIVDRSPSGTVPLWPHFGNSSPLQRLPVWVVASMETSWCPKSIIPRPYKHLEGGAL